MRRDSDRRMSKTLVLKVCTAFAALIVTVMFCMLYLLPSKVKADSEIIISAVPKSTDVGPGDIIIINIIANRFPNITEFGPIEFNYDEDKAEFVAGQRSLKLCIHRDTVQRHSVGNRHGPEDKYDHGRKRRR